MKKHLQAAKLLIWFTILLQVMALSELFAKEVVMACELLSLSTMLLALYLLRNKKRRPAKRSRPPRQAGKLVARSREEE